MLGSANGGTKTTDRGTDAQPGPSSDGETGGAATLGNLSELKGISEPGMYLGTSTPTAAGWQGRFYPARMQTRDFLSYYAMDLIAVEVGSSFTAALLLARLPTGLRETVGIR